MSNAASSSVTNAEVSSNPNVICGSGFLLGLQTLESGLASPSSP